MDLSHRRKSHQDRVTTEFEDAKKPASGSSFIQKMGSSNFGTITKGTVFIISLSTAIIVNVALDLLLVD